MREKDLPFDRTKHVVYTKKAKRCVQRLLRRYYGKARAEELWEKIQLKYCEYLKEEPALGGVKITVSIYDPILLFAWYEVIPEKPSIEEVQEDVFECFMGGFRILGKVFNLNRRLDSWLAGKIFKKTSDIRTEEIQKFPASFRMEGYEYDSKQSAIRYCFTQCPNAEFARRHHLEDVIPMMCNCDHLAMKEIHAALIREGTCCTGDCCDYLIVGDKSPLAMAYELTTRPNGLLVSVPKGRPAGEGV